MLTRSFTKTFRGVTVRSGFFYNFRYSRWQHDPTPIIIPMYHLSGTHPTSGKQWNLFQAINFSYVPKKIRKRFLDDWIKVYSVTNNPKFTWKICKNRYPDIKFAVRRYVTKPPNVIQNLKEVPLDLIHAAVKTKWTKDFSKRIAKAQRKEKFTSRSQRIQRTLDKIEQARKEKVNAAREAKRKSTKSIADTRRQRMKSRRTKRRTI